MISAFDRIEQIAKFTALCMKILSLYKNNQIVVLSGTFIVSPLITGLLLRNKNKLLYSQLFTFREDTTYNCEKWDLFIKVKNKNISKN